MYRLVTAYDGLMGQSRSLRVIREVLADLIAQHGNQPWLIVRDGRVVDSYGF